MSKEEKLAVTTMNQLRSVLWEEIVDLRNGKSTPHRANALAKLAAHILDSTRLEIQNKWLNITNATGADHINIKSIT